MNHKEKKYDRQLRLWGSHGQQALEEASVCLLNATATGTEILKNLILPGIGGFVIIDSNTICDEDIGNNFFFTSDSIGQSKAKVATALLTELNPDVKGDFVEENVCQLIDQDSEFFLKFSLIIACDVEEDTLRSLGRLLWSNDIPMMICTSYGFIGYMRLVYKEVCVTESHPDNYHDDFRLLQPFPELIHHMKTIDLESMDKKEHSHVPYLVVLYKCLEKWKELHQSLPKSYKEKKLFSQFLMTQRKKNGQGVYEEEENFDEALKSVNSALIDMTVPGDVKSILEHENCTNIGENSKPFWILCQALKRFLNEHGSLPLRGSLPDMFSDSKSYIQLQRVYQKKAGQDINSIMDYVTQVYAQLNLGNGKMSETEVKRFCKNSHFLKVVRTKSLEEEFSKTPSDDVLHSFKDEKSDILWYVVLRATQRFHKIHKCYPGKEHEAIEVDLSKMKACSNDLTNSWGVPGAVEAVLHDHLHEICRFGAVELHSIAALMGGVAAQEVIKLLTHQYVPVSDAFIFNGITSSTTTFKV